MRRIPFSQVLKNASIDINREYSRLYDMFYNRFFVRDNTIRDCCEQCFAGFPFRGTCISLNDFDETYHFYFEKEPDDFDINYLVSFCEYTYNLVLHTGRQYDYYASAFDDYKVQVDKVIDLIHYMPNESDEGMIDFIPKDAAAISVSEIVPEALSYRVMEYNHHSMKGDIERKRHILLAMADQLEPKRSNLKQINTQMETDLFKLINNVNVRHNNIDPNNKKFYNPYIAAMKDEEIENWYDDIYQMCLLAFLELDNLERKGRVAELTTKLKE